jgi:hypothetical protein
MLNPVECQNIFTSQELINGSVKNNFVKLKENEVNQGEGDQQSPVVNCAREITDKEDKGEEKKPSENNRKDGSDVANKEEYVHVRARRGQATNSHSLAERVILSFLYINCICNSAPCISCYLNSIFLCLFMFR